jgi:hypothetical protein
VGDGMTKWLTSFRKPLQWRMDMILLTLLITCFLSFDINEDSNERLTLTRLVCLTENEKEEIDYEMF